MEAWEDGQVCVYLSGIVQGVGMRYYVQRQAREMGIKGYVQNLPDERVKCVAQGEPSKLRELVTLLQNPPVGKVTDVTLEKINQPLEFADFDIRL